MTVNLSLFAGAGAQFFDNNGLPLSGGLLYSYAAGTTTQAATYTSNSGSIANSNPIVLDSAGRVPNEIWLTQGSTYKFVLQTSAAVQIGSWDNIPGSNDLTALLAFEANLASSTGSSLIGYNEGSTNAVTTTVQAKLQQTLNIFDFIPVNLQSAIIARTSTSDVTTYIQAAINYASSIGGADIYFPAGKFNVSATINWASYVNMYGIYGETPNSGVNANAGTVFNWIGSSSATTKMFSCIDIRECTLEGFAIEGNGATGLTAILYDSTDGSAAECTFTKFAIRECFIGVQWGTTGLSPANAAQGQFITFTIWSAVANSVGIVVNSGNVGQQCLIEHGGLQCASINLDIVAAQLLQVRRVFSGGHPSVCGFRAAAAIEVLFEGCSSENRDAVSGNFTANSPFLYVVSPPSTFQMLNFCINLIGNQCNNPILITSPIRINSIGNDFGYCYSGSPATTPGCATGYATSNGSLSRVVSINDGTQLWQTGFPYASGWQPSSYLNLTNINPDGSTFNQNTSGVFAFQNFGIDRGWACNLTSSGYAGYFTTNGTSVGNISTSGSGTTYNATSDYRLKHNPSLLTNSGSFIDSLQPKQWTWATDGSKGVGFIAHEVQAVSPSTVQGEKDAVDKEGKPIYQSMEYGSSEFIANIIAELQSLRARLKAANIA